MTDKYRSNDMYGAPNCYECKWLGQGPPGDAHRSCLHPMIAIDCDYDPIILVLAGILNTINSTLPCLLKDTLHVEGNEHGIKHGWFYWPISFDPVWLVKCNGFEKRA